MTLFKRTVGNGRAFRAADLRIARNHAMNSCAYGCGEKATLYDHIDPLENGGISEHTNCAYICTRCHHDKTKKERQISELGNRNTREARMTLHVAYYLHKIFTVDGARKPGTMKFTIAKKQKVIQKIAYYERLIRRTNNVQQRDHLLKLRAKWRRNLRGKKEW